MGLWDRLTGTKRPADGVAARPVAEVRAALLAVGEGEVPWVVVEGGDEGADLTGQWRIDEPVWRVLFLDRKVDRLVTIHMRLDEAEHEVRAVDRVLTVTWREGIASLSVDVEATRGVSTHKTWRGTLDRDGLETTWSFNSDDLKDPLRDAALACGWTWKGVTIGKL